MVVRPAFVMGVVVVGIGTIGVVGPARDVAGAPSPPGVRVVSVGDVVVYEGNAGARAAAFTISLSEPASGTVSVAYSTANATATQPGDYRVASGTLSFSPGQTNKTVSVAIAGDTTIEPDETFRLSLSSPVGALIGDRVGVGTINNDDPSSGLRLAIGDARVIEGNRATRLAALTVSLSRAAAGPVTVAYSTTNGTATQPSDYLATSGTLSFSVGQISKLVNVKIVGDTIAEAKESFSVLLSDPTGGAIITDGTGRGTIGDDDGCPSWVVFGQALTGCSIGSSGEQDRFGFSGSAGQRVRARAVRTSGTGFLSVQILNANGVQQCVMHGIADTTAECVVNTAVGTVVVFASGTDTPNYNLHLQRLDSPAGCVNPGFGSTSAASIASSGEQDCFGFSGSAGQRVRARAVRTSGTGFLSVQILNANGVQQCVMHGIADTTAECVVNTAVGTVVVFASGTDTPNYNLHLQRLA